MPRKKVVYRNRWLTVEEEFYGGTRDSFRGRPFYRIRTGWGVTVLAVTKKKKIVLVRQFRPAIEEIRLELPTGGIDAHESPGHTALRELYEETGYRAKRLILLARDLPLIGSRVDARTDIYFAPDVVLDPDFIAKEPVGVKLVSTPLLKKMILRGKFKHASGIIALQLATWKHLIK